MPELQVRAWRKPLDVVPREEAIVAWRYWGIGTVDGKARLQSPFRATPWPVGEPIVAQHFGAQLGHRATRRGHSAPDARCRCGIYGGTYRSFHSFLDGNLMRPPSSPVLGRVLLWGSVAEEDSAWRAELAYPQRLLVPTLLRDAYRVAHDLEDYGVPVTLMDVGETYSALHPTTRVRAVE